MNHNPDWLEGYKEGLKLAADEVETHWNESDRLCNQKEQAARSAALLRRIATEATFNIKDFPHQHLSTLRVNT